MPAYTASPTGSFAYRSRSSTRAGWHAQGWPQAAQSQDGRSGGCRSTPFTTTVAVRRSRRPPRRPAVSPALIGAIGPALVSPELVRLLMIVLLLLSVSPLRYPGGDLMGAVLHGGLPSGRG